MRQAAFGLVEPHVDLATLLARGLVSLDEDDLSRGNLTLELGITLWMSRAGATLPTVRRTLFSLRRALLRASDLDEVTEPVPLMAGEERAAILALAVYLYGLLHRAALSVETSPAGMVEEALALMAA